jgi:hypothetical protein
MVLVALLVALPPPARTEVRALIIDEAAWALTAVVKKAEAIITALEENCIAVAVVN